MNFLLDIAPYPDDYHRIIHPPIKDQVKDTVDTVVGTGQQVLDNVQNTGMGTGGKVAIIAAILAALAALAICIFFVAHYRRKMQMNQLVRA